MNESLLQLRELLLAPTFLPVAALLVLLAAAALGLRSARWRKALWALCLAAALGAFCTGVLPHGEKGQEWREVLFNGQLL